HSVLSLRLVKALATPRLLHSFPTRRSSDLAQGPAPGSATGSHAVARQRSCCAAPAPGTRPASPGGGGSRPDGSSAGPGSRPPPPDRKSTRLNSSHVKISYAVFCLKKKKQTT